MRDTDVETTKAALLSAGGRAAVADGDTGRIIRFVRRSLGWTQTELGRRAGYSQAAISRLENGTTRISRDVDVISDIGATLSIPLETLGITVCDHEPAGRRADAGVVPSTSAIALLPRSIADSSHIESHDVADGWRSLRRLVEIDGSAGGADCYPVAIDMCTRLQSAVNGARMSPAVATELKGLTAATMQQAGWVAYDGGPEVDARRWWLESLYLADAAGAAHTRVTTLAAMSLQTSVTPSRARETLALVQAARSALRAVPSSVALSLLAAREAVAQSQIGDKNATRKAFTHAEDLLAHGRSDDEPAVFDFWGPADLACHETRAAMFQHDARVAESTARIAYTAVDGTAFRRNHAIYALRLGHVLAVSGQLEEAVAVTGDVTTRFDAVRGSRRVRRDMTGVLDMLGSRNHRPTRDFATAARKVIGRDH